MKTKSKALLLSLCMILLAVASVFGTLAYLTDTDEVKNTFTVGSVSITLDEKDVDDSTENAERDTENEYHLLPGHTYDKDPTVHVAANSENSYIFVKVENEIAAIEGGTTIATQITTNGWKELDGVDGVYYKEYTKSDTVTDLVVFDNFTINGEVDNDTLAIYGGKTIKVTAYAIQMDGFNDSEKIEAVNVAAAWSALTEQLKSETEPETETAGEFGA